MSTTAEKLNRLLNTKADIKAALVEKGQTASDIFSTYADKIRAIETCPEDALFVNSETKTAAMPSKSYWNYATYGGGKFVTVAYNTNKAAYSVDGIKWVGTTLPCTANWTSVAYGNGLHVAVAYDTNVVAYSTDAVTWHEAAMPTSSYWYSVTYGNGKFVAVSSGTANAAYSTDGVNWIDATMPVAKNWRFVTYANGLFVAVGAGTDGCAYSADGINWTGATMPSSATWQSVTYGNGMFVATSNSSPAAYSVDGVNWTATTMPVALTWKSVVYGEGKFVSVGFGSDSAAYSVDGINWTAATLPADLNWQSVAYGNGVFSAITYNNNVAAVSRDGVNWTRTIEVSAIVDVNDQDVTEETVVKVVPTQEAMTIKPGLFEQTAVASGVYTTGDITVKGDANLTAENIRSGVSIFGVAGTMQEGVDTSDATAAATDIVKGKTAYVNGEKITGSVYEVTSGQSILTDGEKAAVVDDQLRVTSEGMTSDRLFRSSSKIRVDIPLSDMGNATAADVVSGKTFTSSAGLKVTGTMVTEPWTLTYEDGSTETKEVCVR